MQFKYDVVMILHNFISMIENQFKGYVKIIRTDNGNEFINNHVSSLFLRKGSYTVEPVLTHHSRIEWWKGNIDICLMLQGPCNFRVLS